MFYNSTRELFVSNYVIFYINFGGYFIVIFCRRPLLKGKARPYFS
jgi:hypothetical protein